MPRARSLRQQRDEALAELVNIAFGHAARPLSELLSGYIRLKVPSVERMPRGRLGDRVAALFGFEQRVHMVRQTFRPNFRGESLLILDAEQSGGLATVLGMPVEEAHEREQRSAILEIGNILTGACIGKLSELLETISHFSPPVLVAFAAPVKTVAMPLQDDLTEAILIRTDLDVEMNPPMFGCLMLLLPEPAARWLDEALDRFLAKLF
jgi:chemotaxis protein CheC